MYVCIFTIINFLNVTEAWRHCGDDIWWALCHIVNVTFLHLHRIDIQWVFLCSFWVIRSFSLCLSGWFLQVLFITPFLYLFYFIFLFQKNKIKFSLVWCRDATTIGSIKVRDTYPFGVDPIWHGTRSELPFLNSLKMKMSILIGVAQMNLGIILSFVNALYFRNSLNIW